LTFGSLQTGDLAGHENQNTARNGKGKCVFKAALFLLFVAGACYGAY
jgi:hypothetical protein